jgi:hypothetical protein
MFCPLLTISHPSQSPTNAFPCKGIVSPPYLLGGIMKNLELNKSMGGADKQKLSEYVTKRIPELRNSIV